MQKFQEFIKENLTKEERVEFSIFDQWGNHTFDISFTIMIVDENIVELSDIYLIEYEHRINLYSSSDGGDYGIYDHVNSIFHKDVFVRDKYSPHRSLFLSDFLKNI